MTIIHFEIVPTQVRLRMQASQSRVDPLTAEDAVTRVVVLESPLQYAGTYVGTKLTLTSNGRRISLPGRVITTIRASLDKSPVSMEIAYVPEYRDEELGHHDPTHIGIDVSLEKSAFSDLWNSILGGKSLLPSASVMFTAPKADAMGREVFWNADEVGNLEHPIEGELFTLEWRVRDVGSGRQET